MPAPFWGTRCPGPTEHLWRGGHDPPGRGPTAEGVLPPLPLTFFGHPSTIMVWSTRAGHLHLPSQLGAHGPSIPLFLSDPPFVSLAHEGRCNEEPRGPERQLSVHLFGKEDARTGGSPRERWRKPWPT